MWNNRRFRVAALLVVVVGVVAVVVMPHRCISAAWRYGVKVPVCPEGNVQVALQVQTSALRRGEPGFVSTHAQLMYVHAGVSAPRAAPIDITNVSYGLVRDGKETNLPLDREPRDGEPRRSRGEGRVTLPADLTDGDYLLRVRASTAAGEATLDAPLPVYAPAKVHVLTDRPLYQPGQTIKFRGVLLRARDRVPLDRRPGTWTVIDAQGTTVLQERVDAGEYGIVDGELPLDTSSPLGMWRVRFSSGDASGEAAVEVKPFELPRFTVSGASARPFVGRGDVARVRLDARSAAGVPVAADVELSWSARGAWPPPAEFLQALPKRARTDRSGRVELELPRVPDDLMGKCTLVAALDAVDDTGDHAAGMASVLLAQDAIDVDIVSELGIGAAAGLVAGMNNRAYLRVTSADGVPQAGASVLVKRAWDKTDKGTSVEADEDGVAALQIDPGPAVNVLVPPLPVRLPPAPPAVQRTQLTEVLFDLPLPLNDVVAVDGWNPLAASCARYAKDGESAKLQVKVEPSGAVSGASAEGPLASCIGAALRGRALSPGPPRVLELAYVLRPPLATLSSEALGSATLPEPVSADLAVRLLDARECLGRFTRAATLPRVMSWELRGARFSASFEKAPASAGADVLDGARAACVERQLSPLLSRTLKDEDATGEGGARFGAMRFQVVPVAGVEGPRRVSATTMLGYELLVSASAGGKPMGETRLRVSPGVVPPLRLRPSKVIAAAGDEIGVEILRGDGFQGELPKKLQLSSTHSLLEADVDKATRTARFKLPPDHDGWYEVRLDAAVARVFVPKAQNLAVALTPEQQSYRPGTMARIAVKTSVNGAGSPAAVGVFGVDATLAQVTTLPGPGALDSLTPTVTLSAPAFGVIDAAALSLGRVRGKNAAAAVLLVTAVPTPEEVDVSTTASAQTELDAASPLADRFFTVLDALYAQVRGFEASAPAGEKLTPDKALSLWDAALRATEKSGKPITDYWGRPLRLALLPDELLSLTDPRLLVADGTRLPEDVEAWVPFVRRSRS